MKHDGTNDSNTIIRHGRGRAKRSRRPHDMIGVARLIISICFCFCLFLVAMSWLCETVLQQMLSSFLNLNALPVPLLRQVFLDPSDMRFPHVFMDILSKISENYFSGLTFPHVFIDILLSGKGSR